MKERLSTSCKELLLLTEESIKLLRIENARKIRNSLLLKKTVPLRPTLWNRWNLQCPGMFKDKFEYIKKVI